MKKSLAVAAICLTICGIASAQSDRQAKLDQRIDASHAILHELMDTPDKGIPLDIAAKAQCIAVVPSFKKGAFVFGAEYGQGVATCRTRHGWSTDLVLVGVSRKSLDALLRDKVKLGGDIAVAAGPVGRNSQASTTELASAGFLTYSRSKGLFAGIDLNGDVVHQNSSDTDAYYGKNIPYKVILGGGVKTPASAVHFVATCNELFRVGRARAAQ
jgi:lipid-binding SYLF domain-containing protein